MGKMSEKRFKIVQDPRVQTEYFIYDNENKISRNITDYPFNNEDVCSRIVMLFNEQQDIIDKQELRLQHLEELLELSENLNKSYREKLIDMKIGELK